VRRAVAFALALCGAASAARAGVAEPIYIVDAPTAGLLGHGEYHIQGRVGPESSILGALRLGIKQVVHLGVSFGVAGVFERGSPDLNDRAGFEARLRLVAEGQAPAVAVGFSNQGAGRYEESLQRYERKSKGFYAVVSRNWRVFLGQVSLHGGINYSLERADQESVDLFAAADWGPFTGLAFVLDWDAALDDDESVSGYGSGRTYLDAAVRVTYGDNLTMMLVFRDLTGNFAPDARVWREFEVAYVNFF
jgi:hypothetical protein